MGNRQRHHDEQSRAADDQVLAFYHFRQGARNVKRPVQPEEDQEMQAGVKEGIKPQCAPGEDNPVPAADFSQRCHQQRQ